MAKKTTAWLVYVYSAGHEAGGNLERFGGTHNDTVVINGNGTTKGSASQTA